MRWDGTIIPEHDRIKPVRRLYALLPSRLCRPPGTVLLLVYYLWFHPNAAARPPAAAPAGPPAPVAPAPAAPAPAGTHCTGTLRSLKGHAAGRVSAVRYVAAGGVEMMCQSTETAVRVCGMRSIGRSG